MAVIARGAEALIRQEGEEVVKERVPKGYRIRELDEALRKRRNRTEAAVMREARRAGVPVPQITEEKDFSIKMQFLEGAKIRDALNDENCIKISQQIATLVARLHDKNIIHGDLTTSNMILRDGQLHFIDFGLGFLSRRIEDKAVDLHLLREALESTHFSIMEKSWSAILETYKNACDEGEKVIKTLAEIEKRGRYKER